MDEARVQAWRTTLHNEHIDKKQVRNDFKLTSCKHLDAEIRDKILKLITRKTLFIAQIERAYSGEVHRPLLPILKIRAATPHPETLYHALADCKFVRDVVV